MIFVIIGVVYDWWLWVIIAAAVYAITASISTVFYISKHSKLLNVAHLQLSLFLRAENNRYYLQKGLELRPGYQAQWIEVSILEDNDPAAIISMIHYRH